jgi:hypothetical protein
VAHAHSTSSAHFFHWTAANRSWATSRNAGSVRDIVSVVPGVWATAIRRSWTGPNLAGTSDVALGRRIQQFQRREQFTKFAGILAAMSIGRGLASTQGLLWSLGEFALVSLLAFPFLLAALFPPPLQPASRGQRVSRHRGQLQTALKANSSYSNMMFWFITIAFGLWTTWHQENSEFLLRAVRSAAALLAVFFWARHKNHRLRRELEVLQ